MKYYSLLVVFVLLSIPLISFGQTAADSLRVTDQNISFSQRLFIEPRMEFWTLYRGTIAWDAYQGFTRISELNLLEMAGYPEQSLKARLTIKKSIKELIMGSILLTLGSTVHSLGENDVSKQEERVLKPIGIGVGVTGSYFVVKSIYRLYNNYIPYTLAKQIAEDYNSKLETTYSE